MLNPVCVAVFGCQCSIPIIDPTKTCKLAVSVPGTSSGTTRRASINSVQTRCIVKGEAQKIHFSGDFLGAFDFLRSACSLEIPPENL